MSSIFLFVECFMDLSDSCINPLFIGILFTWLSHTTLVCVQLNSLFVWSFHLHFLLKSLHFNLQCQASSYPTHHVAKHMLVTAGRLMFFSSLPDLKNMTLYVCYMRRCDSIIMCVWLWQDKLFFYATYG